MNCDNTSIYFQSNLCFQKHNFLEHPVIYASFYTPFFVTRSTQESIFNINQWVQMEPRQCKTTRVVQSVKYRDLLLKSCMWDHFMVVQAVLYDTTYFEYTGTPYQTLSIITLEDFHIPSETSGGNPVLWFTVRRLSSYTEVGNK